MVVKNNMFARFTCKYVKVRRVLGLLLENQRYVRVENRTGLSKLYPVNDPSIY